MFIEEMGFERIGRCPCNKKVGANKIGWASGMSNLAAYPAGPGIVIAAFPVRSPTSGEVNVGLLAHSADPLDTGSGQLTDMIARIKAVRTDESDCAVIIGGKVYNESGSPDEREELSRLIIMQLGAFSVTESQTEGRLDVLDLGNDTHIRGVKLDCTTGLASYATTPAIV